MSNVVYFIQAGARIKIGYTKNLKGRLAAIHTSSPEPAVVLATVPGGKELEKYLHQRAEPHRYKNEWFNDCPEVRALMAEVASGVDDGVVQATTTPKQVNNAEAPRAQNRDDDLTNRLLEDVQNRFAALVHHPIIDQVYAARDTERRLAMERGALISDLLGGEDPVGAASHAFTTLRKTHRKFCKVFDRLCLNIMGDDKPEEPLRRAAEILVAQAEGAFAALQIKASRHV